jgi:flagellar assembly factor FliW
MIRIEGTRFGVVEVDDQAVIDFPNGLVGFPQETRFVLLERGVGRPVGYLQSTRTPSLAFPVTDGSFFPGYPDPPLAELARSVGLGDEDLAVLVIVATNSQTRSLEANMLAPLVVDVSTRQGAQVVLDARKYSATASLADPIAAVKARINAIKHKELERKSSRTTESASSPVDLDELPLAVSL